MAKFCSGAKTKKNADFVVSVDFFLFSKLIIDK